MRGTNGFQQLMIMLSCFFLLIGSVMAQSNLDETALDKQVKSFLNKKRYQWRDMNVPRADGQTLYDIVIKHGYTQALEIGTSTGHSAIWIAWALSKTGGKLITIDIDERRYKEAMANFKEAGLSKFIDARLGDAHKMVPELEGPFDFVFSDADKHWYKNYFIAVDPKLLPGACYVTHNISNRRRGHYNYLDYLLGLPDYKTTVDERGGGMSISYKRSIE